MSEHEVSEREMNRFADEFLDAIVAGDTARVLATYAEGATIWHNFDNLDQVPADNVKTLRALHRLIPGFHYDEIRRTVLPDGFWQQHVLRATTPNGELSIPAALRVYVSDGTITRLEEYLDPAPFAAAIGR